MNVLNKGRCSRCIASEIKPVLKNDKIYRYRFCNKYQKMCRGCSARCPANPMGLDVVEMKGEK